MKYFVVSDIHSFYGALKKSLDEEKYDPANPNHTLIVLGDIFDRGNETMEVYNFIKSIPESNRILVLGNHEQLYKDLLQKSLPESYDYSNGTVKTFCNIAGVPYEKMDIKYWYVHKAFGDAISPYECLEDTWMSVKSAVRKSPVTEWLYSDEWVNYYEIDKYIMVHSFIPLLTNYGDPQYFQYREDWRNATNTEWEDSRWGCPWKLFKDGYFNKEISNGKVLVCGHWDTYSFFKNLSKHKDITITEHNAPVYKSKNLIALDTCTVLSGTVGVFTFTK